MSDIPTFADLVSLCEAHDLQPPSISASDGQVTVTVRVGQVPISSVARNEDEAAGAIVPALMRRAGQN